MNKAKDLIEDQKLVMQQKIEMDEQKSLLMQKLEKRMRAKLGT